MMCVSHAQDDRLEALRKGTFPRLPQTHTRRVEFGSESLNCDVLLACSEKLVDARARHRIRCRELRVKITLWSTQSAKLRRVSLHGRPFPVSISRPPNVPNEPRATRMQRASAPV